MKEFYDRIYDDVNSMTLDLLGPIRTSKKINREAFEKLYHILEELKNKIKGEEFIPRKLAGLLFFIYKSMMGEAYHSKYPDSVFMETAKYGTYLDDIIWDSPFKDKI